MNRRLGLKALLILGLLVLLMIPLAMLGGLVSERQQRAAEVRAEIAQSTSREQTVLGPLLLLKIERTEAVQRTSGFDSAAPTEIRRVTEVRVVAPAELTIDSRQRSELRTRGLFDARLFHDETRLQSRFQLPAAPTLDENLLGWRIESASAVLGVGDSRGIRRVRFGAGSRELEAAAGTGLAWWRDGVQAQLPLDLLDGESLELDVQLGLSGSASLSWIPSGGETRITLASDWPHPGFSGDRLPESRRIDATGFEAVWTVSKLASRAHQLIGECGVASTACSGLAETAFGVNLVDPVDRYLKTERAMKYALLFLVLIFGAVFLIEALVDLSVHPMQYALTGLALAMFFLLLLALTEHVGFAAAYGIAATACVALIATYMAAALGSRRRSVAFAGLLGGLYALLYGLLQSEDHALLIGSLALFALLATAMLLTRRLDWYRLSAREPVPPPLP